MWALYAREVKRFRKLWPDTVFSPIVSIGLYLSVFGIVVGGRMIDGVHFLTFVYTGLIAMMMVNSSFSNPSFALIIAKNTGSFVDLQMVPIAPWRIGIAYALAALTRAIATLAVTLVLSVWFIPGLGVAHWGYLLVGLVLTGLQFGMLGVIFGMVAKGFEAMTFMSTFIMQPMIFLAGVFYPVSALPHPWDFVSFFNPVHHNVNLLRYAVTGYSDVAPAVSLVVTIGISLLFFGIMHVVTYRGVRRG